MSAELPEDLAGWPRDPYELLNVSPGIDPKELRRVYTRLIRTFKPERFPDHFRRIREAYEAVLRDAVAHERLPPPQFFASDDPLVVPPPAEPARVVVPPGPDEEARATWELACRGEEAEAYRRLTHLHERHTGHVELCSRLYWLLATLPELDPARSPSDWLVGGLVASGLTGPLWELYCREIDEHPAEALGGGWNLLAALAVQTERLAELVEARWRAAGRLRRWDVIAADREAWRRRFLGEGERAWLPLLMAAADQLAWIPPGTDRDPWQSCLEELFSLEHLSHRQADTFDRLEFLKELAEGWHDLSRDRAAPPALLDLIAQSWTRPFAEWRPPLMAFLARVARQPLEWLNRFDRIGGRSGAVLSQFGEILNALQSQTPPRKADRPRQVAGALVLDFLNQADWSDYGPFRIGLLEFCAREALPPELVATAATDLFAEEGPLPLPVGVLVGNDAPLKLVYQSHQLFWA